jgi:putative oxidoreductase
MNDSGRYEWLTLIGRVLLAFIFIISGLKKIPGWTQTAGYMAAQGVRAVPFFLALALALELIGGFSILFGLKARFGAFLLFLYLIPVTLVMHRFWGVPENVSAMQMINFVKNFAIMGGLLVLTANGAGKLSLDGLRSRVRPN